MPRAGLTTTRVVEEAEALADEVGLAGVSLAAIAARLDVRVPSLYKHVNGLDALHSLIEARAKAELGDAMARSAVGVSSGAAVDALAGAYRAWARAHPGRYEATLAAPKADDAASRAASERAVRVVFDALAGYGLSGDDAIDATRAFRSALHGFVALEAAGGFGLPQDVDRSFAKLVGALKRSLGDWSALS
ncbi:MAG: WHG domain-containing protein [Rhodoglobus sp.]